MTRFRITTKHSSYNNRYGDLYYNLTRRIKQQFTEVTEILVPEMWVWEFEATCNVEVVRVLAKEIKKLNNERETKVEIITVFKV